MPSTKKLLYYLITAMVILLMAGLAGWYFFLNKQKQAIAESDAGRGLDSAPPTFGGSAGSTYSNVSSTGAPALSGDQAKAPPRLWKVTKTPVAGMKFIGAKDSSASATAMGSQLYFAERGTGYILKADPKTGAITRLTNKLIPRVYEAVFAYDGAVVLRSIDDNGRITSFAGESPEQPVSASSSAQNKSSGGGTAALSGNYLEPDILSIVPRPETRELFLLVPAANGGSSVVLSSWDGKKQKTFFSSPLSEWKMFPLSDGRIFLSLLPSDDVAGFAFEIKNGVLTARLRDIPGLTFLPRSQSGAALFGQSGGEDVSLLYSPKEGSGAEYLPIKTVADKCVWAEPAPASVSGKKPVANTGPLIAYCAVPQYFISKTFLSDWYRGAVHPTDEWWRIDATTGQVTPLLDSGETDQTFDVEGPVIDSAGENIAFMNAKDKSLWILRINAQEKP